MPAQISVSSSSFDYISLLLIGAAIGITLLPVTIALLLMR